MKAQVKSELGFVRVRDQPRVDARVMGVLGDGQTLEVDHLVDGDGGKWAAVRARAGGVPLTDEQGQALYWYVYGIYLQMVAGRTVDQPGNECVAAGLWASMLGDAGAGRGGGTRHWKKWHGQRARRTD